MAKQPPVPQALLQAVETLEEASGVEIIVAFVPRARRYPAPALRAGIVAAFVAHTLFMFVPYEFPLAELYFGPIFAGLLVGMAVQMIEPLARVLIPAKQRQKHLQRLAHDVFVRNHMYQTSERTGLLVVLADFERTAALVADVGIHNALPEDFWQTLEADCRAAAQAPDPAAAMTDLLRRHTPAFAEALPPPTPNLNELPDHITIEL